MSLFKDIQTVGANRRFALGGSQDFAIFLPIQTVIDLNERISGTTIDPDEIVFDQIIVLASSRGTAGEVSDALIALGYNAMGMGSYLSRLNSFFSTMGLMLDGVSDVYRCWRGYISCAPGCAHDYSPGTSI